LMLSSGAPAKKKPPPKSDVEASLRKALDSGQQKVADCVLSYAPDGAWSQTVKVKISINSAGQLMGSVVTMKPSSDVARACIEKVVKALEFPKSAAPLITVEREWTFAQN
jgi:hypothetical protein